MGSIVSIVHGDAISEGTESSYYSKLRPAEFWSLSWRGCVYQKDSNIWVLLKSFDDFRSFLGLIDFAIQTDMSNALSLEPDLQHVKHISPLAENQIFSHHLQKD